MESQQLDRTKAQESRAAIERLYIAMRHLFIRGSYKPLGVSGEALRKALKVLSPEIYGTIADPERVELNGLLYIFQRLPQGIEECRFIKLVGREGHEASFTPLIASKRRRKCYRIDKNHIIIELTRGRSDIYDILTHLTFMYMEAEKIRKNCIDKKGNIRKEWQTLEKIVQRDDAGEEYDLPIAHAHLSTILGRTYSEIMEASQEFLDAKDVNSLLHITYWLGRLSMEEYDNDKDREITFSFALRERIGHHTHGEAWAKRIKAHLQKKYLIHRPIHIISSNLHSVMNSLFASEVLDEMYPDFTMVELAEELSKKGSVRKKVEEFAQQHGMIQLTDKSGTNISVQIFDMAMVADAVDLSRLGMKLPKGEPPILIVMDYAFGEQAYELMDELLKPHEQDHKFIPLNIESISIMGKAGTLKGGKGDILIPNAHVFEGTADNYPFINELCTEDFEEDQVFEGPMITVLGTSLQNRNILKYFHESSWNIIGLEMEGAHYQKAIQAAARIRKNIKPNVIVRYAYYASDNPLISGETLASGSLGLVGVRPTYVITEKILKKILG